MLELIIQLIANTNYCQVTAKLDGTVLPYYWEFQKDTTADYIKQFILNDMNGLVNYTTVTVTDLRA